MRSDVRDRNGDVDIVSRRESPVMACDLVNLRRGYAELRRDVNAVDIGVGSNRNHVSCEW